MDTAKTGAYLASLRKAAGMTQQDAADRLGVSNKTVSKWESGGGFPDITVLPALAELYGVTADDILAGEPVRPGSGGGRVEQYLARRVVVAAGGRRRGRDLDRLGPVRR